MIDIKDISGKILFSVLVTGECEKVEELMKSDYVQLSWNSDGNDIIPAGSYIEYSGEKYSLLEPYSPSQKDEAEYNYQPLFQSKIMQWGKVPFFMYTYSADNVIVSREPEWTLTDNPANFMSAICKAIKNETGETWTYAVDASLPASDTLSFQSIDIFSALNSIANAFDTEWWVDKANKVLHLSKAEHGTAVELKVGLNINTPFVTKNKEGYYTRFYAFGSTRNIVQDYQGANVNNLINKRLTLDPVKYPGGYKDIRSGLVPDEIFSKILVFDNVYPSSSLTISDVRVRLMWTIDAETGEKVQVGTDDKGNPIYDQYAIWYFKIPGFVLNNTNYGKDNPDGMLIPGKALSVHFETGSLQGREFELIYHDKAETVSSADGTSVSLSPGDYEIKFKEEGTYIIPDIAALVPKDEDSIILFNIRMPQEYVDSSYKELETEMDKEIERLSSDLNNYQFSSNPVAFNKSNPELTLGRKVTYVNGDYSYTTRVIKLTTKLDCPYLQTVIIGNDKIKGNTQELKEEVVSANKDINLLSVINDMTASLQQSYQRTQKMMLDGFAAIKNIWQLKEDSNGNKYALSAYDIVTNGGITMYGIGNHTASTIMDGILVDGTTIGIVDGRLSVIGDIGGGTASGIKVNGSVYSPDEEGIITIPNYPTSLAWNDITGKPGWIGSTKPSYSWGEIDDKPSVFPTDWGNVSGKPSWIGDSKPSYGFSEISNKPTTLAGYGITDAYTKNEVTGLLGGYVTLEGAQDITGVKSFVNGFNIGDILVKKHASGVVEIDGDLIVTGGITMYAQGSHSASTIMDGLVLDPDTLAIVNDRLTVVGGTGGGSVDSIIYGTSWFYPDSNKAITLPQFKYNADGLSWGIPSVGTDGVMEVGQYIDFHYPKNTNDYDARIYTTGYNMLTLQGNTTIRGNFKNEENMLAVYGTYITMGNTIGGYFDVNTTQNIFVMSTHKNGTYSRTVMSSSINPGFIMFYDNVLVNGSLKITTTEDNIITFDDPASERYFAISLNDNSSRWARLIFDGRDAYKNMYWEWQGNRYMVLNEYNYAGSLDVRYVLKSGDTINGNTKINATTGSYTPLILSSFYQETYLSMLFNGSSAGGFGYIPSLGMYMYSTARGKYLNYTNDGRLLFEGNTVWHSGNDGSGSGLDADLLDGYHRDNMFSSLTDVMHTWGQTHTITVNGDSNTFYPVAIAMSNSKIWFQRISVWKNLGSFTANYPGNHSNGTSSMWIMFECRNNTWDGNGGFCKTIYNSQGYAQLCADASAPGSQVQVVIVWLRGGGTEYNITADYKTSVNIYYSKTDIGYTGYPLYVEPRTTLGNVGNFVANAGTIPVYGSLATFGSMKTNNIRYECDNSGNYRSHEINDYNAELLLQYDTSNDIIACKGGGNFGIGVKPAYKLHVNGDIYSSSNIYSYQAYITDWVRTRGDTGIYFQDHGGGIHMTDSTYVRTSHNKRFHVSETSEKAISTNGGYDCVAQRTYSWGNGFGTINQCIKNDSGQTPLIVAYRSEYSGNVTGANRLFSLELLNNGRELAFTFGGIQTAQFYSNGEFHANDIYSNGWLRTYNNTGWYNVSHGGGIYMSDDTYIRVYGKEWFRCNYISAGANNNQDDTYSKAFNACGNSGDSSCVYSFIRPGIKPFGIGYTTSNEIWIGEPSSSRVLSTWYILSGSGGTKVRGSFYADNDISTTRWFVTSNGDAGLRINETYFRAYQNIAEMSSYNNEMNFSGNSTALHINYRSITRTAPTNWYWYAGSSSSWAQFELGNILAHGGVTMYYSSDKNLKVNPRPVTNASERLMSLGGVYDFEYIDSEVARNSIYAGTHTGLIYQNVKGGVLDCMAYEREDGKGALNYIDPSFISLLAAVGIEHEGRIEVLERENKELKERIRILEGRFA